MSQHEDDDGEFGPPQDVPVDIGRHVDHAMNSLTEALGRAHWKVGQHAAEVDTLKQMVLELQTENAALKKMYADLLTPTGDPPVSDALLAMPGTVDVGLAPDEQSAAPS